MVIGSRDPGRNLETRAEFAPHGVDRRRDRLLGVGRRIGLSPDDLAELARLYDERAHEPGRLGELLRLLARYQHFLVHHRAAH